MQAIWLSLRKAISHYIKYTSAYMWVNFLEPIESRGIFNYFFKIISSLPNVLILTQLFQQQKIQSLFIGICIIVDAAKTYPWFIQIMILLNNWKQKAKKLPEYIVKHEFQLGIIRKKNNNTNQISTVQNVCSTRRH